MKEITQYKCEICGTLYAEKTECEKCEKQHKIPNSIVKADFRAAKSYPGYPPYIIVKFNDGSEKKYRREG